jgi:predicted PolB exonuclease-like 3'-5' exonuclease
VSLNPAISRSGGGSDLERLPIRRKWSFAQLAMKNPTFSSSTDFFVNNYKSIF